MSKDSVSAAQIRSARAMLGLAQEELAEKAGVTRKTLAGVENGDGQPFDSTRQKVRQALEKLGIEFIEHDGGKGVLLKGP